MKRSADPTVLCKVVGKTVLQKYMRTHMKLTEEHEARTRIPADCKRTD